ncbi:MAG: hypothetical protein BM557_01385 [Flavobacterium sp. MedPE-SWcel]|uniref:hypothetical protein n=1 Tax=uncultured Flavobacterium sp. TaxID=165435 RepID=UPI00091A7299|nr:hypothetical protein [uncultured Flavobacterium sp.]OIQ22059.1 MAG: hypothetical protein BM557_01385 [Flavobacterium sp. MedPE-SWcel]
MKATFKLKLLLLLAAGMLYSCSNDSGQADTGSGEQTQEVSLKEIPVSLKKLNIGSQIILFSYTNVSEAQQLVDAAVADLIVDSKEDLGERTDATQMLTNVKISGGKAYVNEFLFYDENKQELVEGFYYDAATDSYKPHSAPSLQFMSAAINGARCPSGYEQLASCSNFNNPENCIGGALQSYLSTSLSSVGDCLDIHISVGLSKTRVCGKEC